MFRWLLVTLVLILSGCTWGRASLRVSTEVDGVDCGFEWSTK
jgi:hypothetical protein